MKKILIISIWVVLIAGLIFLVVFINRGHKTVKFSSIDINVNSAPTNDFVTKSDIMLVLKQLDYNVNKQNISEIDNEKIEKEIYKNPYILKVDAFTTNDGCLKINVVQRKALIRVINSRGDSYYLDEDACMMPLSTKFTPRIIIAHGNISNLYIPGFKLINFPKNVIIDTNKLTALQKVYYIGKYVNRSDFWKAMVGDMFVQPNGDVEFYLTLGNQTVIFGGADNMGDKFFRLMEFYRQKMNRIGWTKYKSLNLKFNNQIVCSKK